MFLFIILVVNKNYNEIDFTIFKNEVKERKRAVVNVFIVLGQDMISGLWIGA